MLVTAITQQYVGSNTFELIEGAITKTFQRGDIKCAIIETFKVSCITCVVLCCVASLPGTLLAKFGVVFCGVRLLTGVPNSMPKQTEWRSPRRALIYDTCDRTKNHDTWFYRINIDHKYTTLDSERRTNVFKKYIWQSYNFWKNKCDFMAFLNTRHNWLLFKTKQRTVAPLISIYLKMIIFFVAKNHIGHKH